MSDFVFRLSDEDARKVATGEMLAQLENGKILEHPQLWDDKDRTGKPVKSLFGRVNGVGYSWPACGCGVKVRLRAIQKGY